VITIDNDYDRTDDFMVYDIDGDSTDRAVAQQLHEQLEALIRRGLKRVRIPLVKVREYRQDKELSGDED